MVSNVIWLNWNGATYGLQVLSGLQALPDSPIEKAAYLVSPYGRDTHKPVYTIVAYDSGRPKTCSCPHFTKAVDAQGTHPWCKHLQMAERWWRENTEAGKEAQRALEQQAVAAGL